MCDKKFVKVLGGVLALFGVISIIMAITVTTGSSWITDLMPAAEDTAESADPERAASAEFASDAASLGQVFEALIYVFGIYMLVMGMSGWCCCAGKYKGNCLCVVLFLVFQVILILLTLIIAIMPFTIYALDSEDVAWFCSTDKVSLEAELDLTESAWKDMILLGKDYVTQVDDVINAREAIMCTSQCPCDIDNFDAWTDVDTSDRVATSAAGGVDDWAECQALLGAESNQIQTYYDSILSILESEFECQGICTSGDFWLFREVSDGPVEDACLLRLKEDFASPAMAACIVLFITIVIDIALFVCMFGMCKSDDK